MDNTFEIAGQNPAALFTLKVHRGDGMALLAMNWKNPKPPDNFVGFAIEYKEPGGSVFYPLKNLLSFPDTKDVNKPNRLSTLLSPIQKFRWVHFPRNANLTGTFTYQVKPVFMNEQDELSYGEPQVVEIELRRETYPGQLNVAYTRGFVSSQAFVERYAQYGPISTLLPAKAADGLTFKPTHPKAQDAYKWMGFEARETILDVLDKAIADTGAQVRVIAYDLNEPDVVARLQQLGSRLKIIIDNSGDHGPVNSAESQAAGMLKSANVIRQQMGNLQHNKTIAVNGPGVQMVVCGSTNFSWRGFFVQNNNAVVLQGKSTVKPFLDAFDNYWNHSDDVAGFSKTASAEWIDLGLGGIDAKVAFSPHSKSNALLDTVAQDIENQTTSSLLYSLAFLYKTKGSIKDAIVNITANKNIFVRGISDQKVGGIVVQTPDGNWAPVHPATLSKDVPLPFKAEPAGGGGIRMHHKFVVIDFDKPTARVYLGSYNFSDDADTENGENLLLIRDRRVAVSYMVEALSMFDHYMFRLQKQNSKTPITLQKPPRKPREVAWWDEDYTDAQKIRDRELFA